MSQESKSSNEPSSQESKSSTKRRRLSVPTVIEDDLTEYQVLLLDFQSCFIFLFQVGLKFTFGGGKKIDEGREVWCERSSVHTKGSRHDPTVTIEEFPVSLDWIKTLAVDAAKRLQIFSTSFQIESYDFYLATGELVNIAKTGTRNLVTKVI